MKTMLIAGLLGLSALLWLVGCATAPSTVKALPLDIYLDGNGNATVLNEQVPQTELSVLLVRTHVPRQRTLAVHVTDTRDKQTMARLTAAMAQAGYHRITFIGIRHADATVH